MKNYVTNMAITGAAAIFLSGCFSMPIPGLKDESVKAPTFQNKLVKNDTYLVDLTLDKPIGETKIFVDGSKDVKRAEDIMREVYFYLKKKSPIKVELGHEYSPVDSTETTHLNMSANIIESHKLLPTKHCKDSNSECLSKSILSSDIEFINNEIIIDKLQTDEEILMGYGGLVYSAFHGRKKHDIRSKYGIDIPVKVSERSYSEKKLILTNEYLLKLSLKNRLEIALEQKGFKIAKSKEDADYVFEVENVAFSKYKHFRSILREFHSSNKGKTSFSSTGAQIGANTASSAGAGFAAASFLVGLALDSVRGSGSFNDKRLIAISNVALYKKDKLLSNMSLITKKDTYSGINYWGISSESIDTIISDLAYQYTDELLQIKN